MVWFMGPSPPALLPAALHLRLSRHASPTHACLPPAQPDLLFQLLAMLSPRVLAERGVPVYSATQVQAATACCCRRLRCHAAALPVLPLLPAPARRLPPPSP